MSVKLGWSSVTVSSAIAQSLLAFFTIYASDVIGLNTAVVGILLMLSKVFDGISDIVAGFIIDKTHTRFGKARPYALAVIFYWITLGALFSIPVTLTQNVQYLYLFVMYTIADAVCFTLFSCAEAPHMANALEDSSQSIVLLSFSRVIASIAGVAGGVLIPQFAANAGNDPAQWTKLAWLLAIPFAFIGSFRFILVKEKKNVSSAVSSVDLNIKETLLALKGNKYIILLGILVFIAYFGSQLASSVNTYYAKYIIGDLGADSVLSLSLIPVIVVMVLLPVLASKFTLKRVINFLMVLGVVGSLLKLFNPSNLGWVFFCSCMSGVGFTTFYGFASTMVIDCMDYGEYKTGKRVEGVMGGVQSFMCKIGTGFGGAISGLLLSIGGYEGTAEIQSQSALDMIVALASTIPAVFFVIFLVVYRKYDLEARLPEIRQELKKRETDSQSE